MLIQFKCNTPKCKNSITKLYSSVKQIPPFLDCGECGKGKMERQFAAPSSKSTQVIDNGAMSKSIELLNEVVLKEQERMEAQEKEND